ncbi:ketoacyl-ACP synthase III family protein [Pseudomonas sp. nanlin1]|uniref:ketoacyl-ACP synthase III family protein n=1 Tax=Pseudomonas sp. nanlin1 TaxID=3040605 RepID=UPI00388F60B4
MSALEPAVYLHGLAAYVPARRVSMADAIAAGRYDQARASRDGFSALAVEEHRTTMDMAREVGQHALHNADVSQVNGLIFASIHRHGFHHLWPAASYLQDTLGLPPSALAFSLNQGCNALFAAFKTLLPGVRSGALGEALVIGADCFNGSAFDRWNSDLGTLYGDGASAVRLSLQPGPLKILFLDIEAGAGLEGLYRNASALPETPESSHSLHQIGDAKRAWFDQHGRERFQALFDQTLGRLRDRLLAKHDLLRQPARYVVYPNVGAGVSAGLYTRWFADLAQHDHWGYGRSIGHTGVSDQLLGLADLLQGGQLRPGDQLLLIGAGNGLNVSALLLEVMPDKASSG